MAVDKKKEQLENKYGFPMTKSMDEEMSQMCNLGEGIAERAYAEGLKEGIEKGIEKGIEQGESDLLISLIIDKSINVEKALTKTTLPKEEFMEKLRAVGYEEE